MAADTESQPSYHGDSSSKYPLPNDRTEQERLHSQHEALLAAMAQQPVHAPVENPKMILDVGCGVNADMTIFLAKRFPSAKVYGVDLSTVDIAAPANVEFIKGNIRDLATVDPRLKAGAFDYVYSRALMAGVEDWSAQIKCHSELVSPGGFIEMHDTTGLVFFNKEGEIISKDWKWIQKMFQSQSEPPSMAIFQELLHKHGFQQIGEKLYRLYWSPSLRDDELHGPWQRYATSGSWVRTMQSGFERQYPGEENEKLRSELIADVERTIQPEEGKHLFILAVWGSKG